jgi:alkanesulfonate monooxygenase SsuD/methylene tetrahydromethanopterin reductase-like flavin-dependent oxidoreductase (luciferase family)
MHDIAEFETRGIPGVGVASTEFTQAAAAQSAALGFDPAMVFVRHPIQDRTDDEMRALADEAIEGILRQLVKPAVPTAG